LPRAYEHAVFKLMTVPESNAHKPPALHCCEF
jgi:hypothetical protein